jgi:hypothetical protein
MDNTKVCCQLEQYYDSTGNWMQWPLSAQVAEPQKIFP